MIGHELGGRYEIITRIGGGGMALVYKAHDILLNRKVAVKVLRQQFTHDEDFIRRFRREAQSAAALSHPNVVSIYDVGQEEDTHYIVMEYVEGHNLNEIIQERAPLQTEEAVHVAVQICDALEHAHHNQIIHRDIKPHNILIGNNGRVKVTDFGIARAVTSSTITQTGSVVGSVHYFSPEHAKGVSTGEKSDLYSLGIVLYQMLTGRLPFLGESPISVALKHLQETFEEPRVVNPYIPQSVENIILRAMRKNPEERYASAEEMLHDLDTCLLPERLGEPKITFNSHAGDMDETRVMPAIRGGSMETLAAPAVPRPEKAEKDEKQDDRWDSDGLSESPKRRRWVKPVITVFTTLLVIALVYWGAMTVRGWFDIDEVDVPYVVNKTETAARQELEKAGLKIEEPTVYMDKEGVPKDVVYDQSKQNQRVKVGSFIKLYVSTGPKMEKMVDYKGRSFNEVREELISLGVSDERIKPEEEFSEEKPGTVLGQTPDADTEFDPKTASFTFTVSKGPETFPMPNLIGKSEADAIKELKSLGLKVNEANTVREPSYGEAGKVVSQDPYKPNDSVSKGAEVTLTVSGGLPDEAVEYTFNIVISPAQAGKTSEIRIRYSDATGENIELGKSKINDTRTFPVKVVLGPNTEARVEIYRDGELVDIFTRTYDEIKSGAESPPETVPGMEPPVDEPVQTEPDNSSNNHGGNNAEQQ
ncbi:Stk1 family PASTA domain-containing Ser/Thr kinase [Paenibacillus mendelii]|uniref:non-specific serine/threonine protein kinase n=1 Tax=Paenibacillus mendelii TaxID=206163 RepID=A0ABV6J565_9BACL|nr:Stk1 family PASTA domain-containing Ser/Thr kinase [Paenibacillus mendelii]MCQ6560347.1 Stk1 family PASTA domain-containing Ser/Thr kinase [Paenibacillus mendelii]